MRETKIKCDKCRKEISEATISTFQLCGEKFRPQGNMWRDNINKVLVGFELCEACTRIVYSRICNLVMNFDEDVVCPKDDSRNEKDYHVRIGANYIYTLDDVETFIHSFPLGFKLGVGGKRNFNSENELESITFSVSTLDGTNVNKVNISNLQDFTDLFIHYFPDTPIQIGGLDDD